VHRRRRHLWVAEDLLVEPLNGLRRRSPTRVGDLHERGSAVLRMRPADGEPGSLQPVRRVGHAGRMYLESLAGLGPPERNWGEPSQTTLD
jgi:hypothetical protein